MNGRYLGVLPTEDPLYIFLASEVLAGTLGYYNCHPVFDSFSLDSCSTIIRYSDRRTLVDLVGKFYGNKWLHGSQTGEQKLRAHLMHQEFDNLKRARILGMEYPPHRVVRPLQNSEALNCVLVEDLAHGHDLDFVIRKAICNGGNRELSGRLTEVACFLADLHDRTQTDEPVDVAQSLGYFRKIAHQLVFWRIISSDQYGNLLRLSDLWEGARLLEGDRKVLIHGDATPPHFLFGDERDMTVIDLERLSPRDRAADIGRMAAELKHLSFWYGHDPWMSESFIRHLYAAYADFRRERDDFIAFTERGRFYMGCDLLRISRNSWIDLSYRRHLITIAEECLKL